MHTIKLKKREAFDLALVLGSIVGEESEKMEFKEIIKLQTLATNIKDVVVKDFTDPYEAITKERDEHIKILQKKIDAFRKSQLDKNKDGDLDPTFKETVDSYAGAMTADLQSLLKETTGVKYDELYDGIGETECSFEVETDVKTMLVDNFEKHAKKRYTNKSKMIEVYNSIVAS